MTSVTTLPFGRAFTRADAVTVLELGPDGYEQIAHVVGEQSYDVSAPYAMTLVPIQLLDGQTLHGRQSRRRGHAVGLRTAV